VEAEGAAAAEDEADCDGFSLVAAWAGSAERSDLADALRGRFLVVAFFVVFFLTDAFVARFLVAFLGRVLLARFLGALWLAGLLPITSPGTMTLSESPAVASVAATTAPPHG